MDSSLGYRSLVLGGVYALAAARSRSVFTVAVHKRAKHARLSTDGSQRPLQGHIPRPGLGTIAGGESMPDAELGTVAGKEHMARDLVCVWISSDGDIIVSHGNLVYAHFFGQGWQEDQ